MRQIPSLSLEMENESHLVSHMIIDELLHGRSASSLTHRDYIARPSVRRRNRHLVRQLRVVSDASTAVSVPRVT